MAYWKSLFSAELLANAKYLASYSESDTMTPEHLREAAGPTEVGWPVI